MLEVNDEDLDCRVQAGVTREQLNAELKGTGLLDRRLPPGFAVPVPSDEPELREDEDPLEPGDLDLGLVPRPEEGS